ncbi:MAG: ribosome-associated translation inhibitor RaiA [Bacteroidota bacterium]
MSIIIQSPHILITKALNEFTKRKTGKLFQYYDRIESAAVVLKTANDDDRQNKVCEIRLVVPGNDLFAEKHSHSFEEAVNKTVDALLEQLEKVKSKLVGSN